MRRRTEQAADRAAAQASEAARVLQQRSQESKTEKVEPVKVEPPKVEPAKVEPTPEVEKSLGPKVITRRNARREDVLDEIRQSRGEPKEEAETKEPPKEPEITEPKVETETAPEAVQPAPEAPKTVKQIVDGEEHEVPQSEVDEAGGAQAWRIARAQENRLKKMNEANTEAKQREERIAKIAEAVLQRQQPQQPSVTDQQFIAERIDKVRFGTPEEAATAQLEIMQRINKPVDQNALLGQVLSAVDRKQAAADFMKEYPEVAANRLLLKLAVTLEHEELANARKSGQAIDWRSLYSKIGNQVRSVAPARQSQPQATPATSGNPSQASEREARKASITVLPTASSARAELPKEEKPETREESLNRMRKARGQQPQ
jgi:hypothetical protein